MQKLVEKISPNATAHERAFKQIKQDVSPTIHLLIMDLTEQRKFEAQTIIKEAVEKWLCCQEKDAAFSHFKDLGNQHSLAIS